MAKKYDIEKVINDISITVATDFLQLLFNKELVIMAEKQLEISFQQEERIRETGKCWATSKGFITGNSITSSIRTITIGKSQKSKRNSTFEHQTIVRDSRQIPILIFWFLLFLCQIRVKCQATDEIYKKLH